MSIDHNPAVSEWRDRVCTALRASRARATLAEITADFGKPPSRMSTRDCLMPAVNAGLLMVSGMGASRLYVHTGREADAALDAKRKPFAEIEVRGFPRVPSIFHLAQGVTA